VQEWVGGGSYASRTSRLAAGTGGLPKLDSTTVLNDGAADRLEGGFGLDWYFGNIPQDTLVGRTSDERVG
jgi:hypothetical protein